MSKALDIDVPAKKKASFTNADHLEAILFRFVSLYERWSEERQVAEKHSADLSKFVKGFSQQVNQFSMLEEKVRSDIHASVRQEAEHTAIYFSKTIGETAKKEVEPAIQKLNTAVDNSEHVLNKYQSSLRFMNWEMVVVSVFSSLLLSVCLFVFLLPKPTVPLTDLQLQELQIGHELMNIWPKLTKAEKDKLKRLIDKNRISWD